MGVFALAVAPIYRDGPLTGNGVRDSGHSSSEVEHFGQMGEDGNG